MAAVIAVLLVLVIQAEPTLPPDEKPAHQYLSRTRNLLHNTVRDTPGGGAKQVDMTGDDLTAIANFALMRKKLQGHSECTIANRRLKLLATIRLPFETFPLYLNIRLIADDAEPQAFIRQLKLGRLALPAPVTGWLLHGLLRYTPLSRYTRVADPLVRSIRIGDDRLRVGLNWSRDVLDRAEGLVTDLADKERFLVYHDKLAELLVQPEIKRFVRLGPLIRQMFALARSRSANANDPVEENRALILVLSAYVNGKNFMAALPAMPRPPKLERRHVLLNRRIDTAQHFMGSAALAMAGHSTLVDMIGLAKEMHDAHDGSGFSFVDLAADQAGALFGKSAVRSVERAREVQDILSQSDDESQFMPMTKDLPENLTPEDFEARFGDIRSAEFDAMKARIMERIAACPLYQAP